MRVVYVPLARIGFGHSTVGHKDEFVNHIPGPNTLAVESFNGFIKYHVKQQKEAYTERRSVFK